MQETWIQSLGWENTLEESTATYSNILAWRVPWTEEPGGLWSIRLQKAGHDWSDLAHTQVTNVEDNWVTDLCVLHTPELFYTYCNCCRKEKAGCMMTRLHPWHLLLLFEQYWVCDQHSSKNWPQQNGINTVARDHLYFCGHQSNCSLLCS